MNKLDVENYNYVINKLTELKTDLEHIIDKGYEDGPGLKSHLKGIVQAIRIVREGFEDWEGRILTEDEKKFLADEENAKAELDGISSLDAEGNDIYKKAIKIDGIEGFYYVEDNQYLCDCLIHSCDDYADDVQVSDLTELKVWQYNVLVRALNKQYPDYKIKLLTGRFI